MSSHGWRYPIVEKLGPGACFSKNFSEPKSQLSNCNPLALKIRFKVKKKKGKRITKFDGLEPRRREDITGIVDPEIGLKSFGTFEKRAPGARFSKVPNTFRIRKAIRKTPTRVFCKAGRLICCKGNKNQNSCKVSRLETPSF